MSSYNSLKAVDIVLLPSAAMTEKALELNGELVKKIRHKNSTEQKQLPASHFFSHGMP